MFFGEVVTSSRRDIAVRASPADNETMLDITRGVNWGKDVYRGSGVLLETDD